MIEKGFLLYVCHFYRYLLHPKESLIIKTIPFDVKGKATFLKLTFSVQSATRGALREC